MSSLLKTTRNTRAVLPDSMRFVRSDVPDNITAEEIGFLTENNILTVIDLREEDEREKRVCPLEKNASFEYISIPVTGGNAVPECTEDVPLSYRNMMDGQMEKIIDTIMNSDNNVLYFCNAGKDRTGVVSAIILYKLGMDDEYIINDYLKSAANMKDVLNKYAAQNPEVNIDVITPKREYMEEFLSWLRKTW